MNKSVPNNNNRNLSVLFAVLILLISNNSSSQNIDFGKSYINVTKGLNGGTVETGDTLEIRASFVVRAGSYDSCRYRDVVPAGTLFITGSIKVLTNEGKIYKSFTDATGDDPGWINGLNITINLGYNSAAAPASAFRRGRVANTHKPSFYGNTCIMIASFRVRVTAATGNNISTGGGTITYKNGLLAIQTFTFPANILRVYPNYGICSNTVGANGIGTEFNGTFGSGKPRNRGISGNVPVGYTYNVFDLNMPNDYYYGVANNTSTMPNYTTLNNWPKPDGSSPTHRVFSVWDIFGDHTGAVSPTAGNPAADTVANSNGGYMLVINAAYRIDSAFQQTITGLCPSTYYEVSCWMRNICSKCGCDSNGRGASSAAGPPFYIPTAATDSSGVYPNLTFDIDGIDYYTTGNLLYTGNWIRKGFTFLTGPAQTSFILKFFNNAPGGGGNDWALDDISVSTCSPNMNYSPSIKPNVCDSNILTIYDTVRSFFNNYVYYKWQRSTDGGLSWSDVTAPSGPASPFWNGTAWEYVTSYTIPPALTQLSNSGDKYRLVVATTLANLSDINCRFTDNMNIITINVLDCNNILATNLLSFSGNIYNNRAALKWVTSAENELLIYEVEKSIDGISFYPIATLNSFNDPGALLNTYLFTDADPLNVNTFYRLLLKTKSGKISYSKVLLLLPVPADGNYISVNNPFTNELKFDIYSAAAGKAVIILFDASGKNRKQKTVSLKPGINNCKIENTETLSSGVYYLNTQLSSGTMLQKKVIKQYH